MEVCGCTFLDGLLLSILSPRVAEDISSMIACENGWRLSHDDMSRERTCVPLFTFLCIVIYSSSLVFL